MAEQFLFDVAERIIETLGSLAAKKIGLFWGVKAELESLRNTVSTIKAVLLDAGEKRAAGNHAVRDWLGKLEDTMYEADDLLDAVSTEALRREVMTRDKKAKQLRIFFSKSNQLAFRLQMATKIKALRERLDAIDADRQRFNLEVRHVETCVGGNRERDNTHSFVCAETVIGREDDKKAVIRRLLDSNVEDNVLILPIVGIGGLGKTTLAQLIFNDDQIQKRFQLRMWVCVSDPFNVKNIVEKIFEAATNKKQPTVEMNTLVNYLRKEIDGKKYFLVLDDVWNEDHEKWSKLKEVLMGGARGSRIVVTTRAEKVASTIRRERVASIIKTIESYSLRGLDDGESWSLFKQMAFENGQEPVNSSIVKLGKEMLQMCSGVPLAIRTFGRLLGSKNPETEWLSFKNNELSKISDKNETDIIRTLKLSYDHLPSHLKHCFAYCALFPKDYWFHKSRLVQLWIAQGFVSSDQNAFLKNVGNDYFMDLLWRSFFQEAITDEIGNVIACKMHDLMHDLAVLVAEHCFVYSDSYRWSSTDSDWWPQKYRHVSVVGSRIYHAVSCSPLCGASVRTLLCLHNSHDFCNEFECQKNFSRFKFLRVLDLQERNLDRLPSNIGKLKHLRYLDLSSNKNLQKLPNSITRLQNLQTLILSYCEALEELPRDITKLVNLRHLEIDECSRLAYMPCGLGQLTNLQTLSNFVVHKDPLSLYESGLKELNRLNNLRGELDIKNLSHGKVVAPECEAANLKEKQHLHALDLRWTTEGGGNHSTVNVDDEVLLEILQPHPNLKELCLERNYGSRLPSWLLTLTNLVRFELRECRKCQYLPPLSQLPSLKALFLIELDDMEYISDSDEFSSSSASVPFFPSLKEISLNNCPNLNGWWRRRDSSVEVNSDSQNSVEITEHPLLPFFPRLSRLWILNCPMLTSMPMFPHLEEELFLENASWRPLQQTMNMVAPRSTTSTATSTSTASSSSTLSKLKSIKLDFIEDLETLPEEWLKNLTSLESLTIWNCNRLTSLSPGIQQLIALQDLDLSYCPELELTNDEDGMQWQGLKSLLSLVFTHLPKLVSLPLGLQHATTLQMLEISNCENLTAIPEWIHNCTSLQVLEIDGCSSLTSLPEGIDILTSLQKLKIKDCPILLQRCMSEAGEDWPKIARIPELDLQNPNSDAEVVEPAKAQKK